MLLAGGVAVPGWSDVSGEVKQFRAVAHPAAVVLLP
jgi:hypothetical protein